MCEFKKEAREQLTRSSSLFMGFTYFSVGYAVGKRLRSGRKKDASNKFFFSDVFFHHRASVYGVAILADGSVATGSMDGTISIIDGGTMTVKKHFMAHDEEGWGVSDLEASADELYSGSLSGHIRSWSLPTCSLVLDIDAGHAVNCISVHNGVVASCSR